MIEAGEAAMRASKGFAVAGSYDNPLLNQLRIAEFLLFVDASVWERWERTDVHLLVPNDRELWSPCER